MRLDGCGSGCVGDTAVESARNGEPVPVDMVAKGVVNFRVACGHVRRGDHDHGLGERYSHRIPVGQYLLASSNRHSHHSRGGILATIAWI